MTTSAAATSFSGWRSDRGTVLIVTMWVVIVLAGLVLVFAQAARVDAQAAANGSATLRADAAAQGGLQYCLSLLDGLSGDHHSLRAVLEDADFEARQVGDAYFWVRRVNLEDDRNHYFGLTELSSRINLNSASVDMLLRLPSMTAELADSIVDWRDPDAQVSPSGAESEFYLLLEEPYHCKDSRLETVEEVLLIRGAEPDLLYGEDVNRNGVLDASEDRSRNGRLDQGFLHYVTVHTYEPNLDADGSERVNVNDLDTGPLGEVLEEVVDGDRIFTILQDGRRGRPYDNILEYYFRSGLTFEEFAAVADRLTAVNEETLPGLVNVNTAPREVLLCLPALDESDVDALLSARQNEDAAMDSIAWVAQVLPPDKAGAVGSHITTRSFQFSADVVAASGDGRAYRRYRFIIDAAPSPPVVIRRQDLTHLGWPLDPAVVSALREGEF